MSLTTCMINLIPDGDGKTKKIIMIVGFVVGVAVLLSACLIIICFKRRNSGSTLTRRESKGTEGNSIRVQQVMKT